MIGPTQVRLPDRVQAGTLAGVAGPVPVLAAIPPDDRRDPSRPPVLFVPGFGGSKEDFVEILEPTLDAGYCTVALDLRGQYGSFTTDDPAAYELSGLAVDVLGVAATVQNRLAHGGSLLDADTATLPGQRGAAPEGETGVHLVGYSFGGLVARMAALADPASLRSLTLMDCGPDALPGASSRTHLLRTLLEALPEQDLRQIYSRKRQRELESGAILRSPEVEDFLRERFLAHCPVGLRRMAEQLLDEPDRTQALAGLVEAGLPVHVLYGQHEDAWPPTVIADMAARLGAQETVIPDAAHAPAVEQPKRTAAALIDFWQSVDAPASVPVGAR